MENQRVPIEIKGIQRNVSPIGAPAGTCKDIVNLRPKDGAWRPVLPKTVEYSGHDYYANTILELFNHDPLPDDQFLCRRIDEHGDGTEYVSVIKFNDPGQDINILQNLVSYNPLEVEFKSLVCINDIVIISTTRETTFHLYKGGEYVINDSIEGLPELRIAMGNHDYHVFELPDSKADTWAEVLANYLNYKKVQAEDHNRYDGNIILIAAYRMLDGTLIKMSAPVINRTGTAGVVPDSYFGYKDAILGEYWILGHRGGIGNVDVRVSKAKFRIAEFIPKDWLGVIDSVDVFAAHIPFADDPDTSWELATDDPRYFVNKDVAVEIEKLTFHKIDSVNLAVPSGVYTDYSNTVIEKDIDLKNLAAKEALLPDPLSNHQIGFEKGMVYNGRIHAANTQTLMFSGHHLDLHHPDWQRTNNDDAVEASLKALPDSFTTWNGYIIAGGGTYLRFRVWIDAGGGTEEELSIEMPVARVIIDTVMFERQYDSTTDNAILLNRLITYPDPRAKRFEVLEDKQEDFDDWFLPSKDELNKMYVNLHSEGEGQFVNDNYWASSETSAQRVWVQQFASGHQTGDALKYNTFRVRPVRAFTLTEGSASYALRDNGPAGGKIFDVVDNEDGTYTYYEASFQDYIGIIWSNITNAESGATGTAVGTGATNTAAIIAQAEHTGSAAKLCDDYGGTKIILAGEFKKHPLYNFAYYLSTLMPGWTSTAEYGDATATPDVDNIVKIHDPNRLQLSEIENPFLWPAKNSYRIGEDKSNKLIDLAVQSAPTSEGQFGEYPLVVFAQNGIYLVNQGTGDVIYSNIINISRLKANEGVLGIDGAIMFTTADGLFILQGRETRELNRFLISNIIYATEHTDTPENPHGDTSGGLEFLQWVRFAWDNQHREIIINRYGEDYHYRFNPELNMFFIASGSCDDFLIRKGSYKGFKVSDENNIIIYDIDSDDDSEDEVRIYFKTNPQLLTSADFKKIQRLILYVDAVTEKDGYLNLFIFGGNIINSTTPYHQFMILQQNKVDEENHPVHMITGRTPVSVRYFVLMLSGQVNKDSVIQHMEAEISSVLARKLR